MPISGGFVARSPISITGSITPGVICADRIVLVWSIFVVSAYLSDLFFQHRAVHKTLNTQENVGSAPLCPFVVMNLLAAVAVVH